MCSHFAPHVRSSKRTGPAGQTNFATWARSGSLRCAAGSFGSEAASGSAPVQRWKPWPPEAGLDRRAGAARPGTHPPRTAPAERRLRTRRRPLARPHPRPGRRRRRHARQLGDHDDAVTVGRFTLGQSLPAPVVPRRTPGSGCWWLRRRGRRAEPQAEARRFPGERVRPALRAALKEYGKFSPRSRITSVVLRLMRYLVASLDA
jgi:hypothetical protein